MSDLKFIVAIKGVGVYGPFNGKAAAVQWFMKQYEGRGKPKHSYELLREPD